MKSIGSLDNALLSYGHLKFFTLCNNYTGLRSPISGERTPDIGDRRPDTQVILYPDQCCYAVHWTDNNCVFAAVVTCTVV